MSDPEKKPIYTCRIDGVMPGLDVVLCHSEKKAKKLMRRIGMRNSALAELRGCSRAVTLCRLDAKTARERIFIVYLGDCEDMPYEEALALLVHEAVHIQQEFFRRIGEQEPADEEQAYVVQAISQCLMFEHRKWLSKRLKETGSTS